MVMDFCIKTFGQFVSQAILWISAAYLWLVDSNVEFIDDSIKYVPLAMALISGVSYLGLTRLKKKQTRMIMKKLDAELENENLEIEIKKKQLEKLNTPNGS
jgi:hypothetical protein